MSSPSVFWIWILVGGFCYQLGRIFFDCQPTWETLFSQAFWSGVVLLSHHFGLWGDTNV